MKKHFFNVFLHLLCAAFIIKPCVTNAQRSAITTNFNYAQLADSLQHTLVTKFSSTNGKYFKNAGGDDGLYYWPNAHALDVLIDGYLRTKDKTYLIKMKTLLSGIKAANGNTFSNEYYDDMAWLALASLRAYGITNDADYLKVAQQLYAEIKTGWNTVLGGGIAWRKGQRTYKNMPGTGNMCILAARFYKLNADSAYLNLAKALFNWMKNTLVNSTGEVQDGINRNNDGMIDHWIFTYNQGLYIGSAVEMYTTAKEKTYLQDAIKTADNVLTDTALISNGYLKSEGQGDHGLFKGILVRYFTQLIELPGLDKSHRDKYAFFLQRNARALYTKGISRPSLLISPDWTQTLQTANTDLTTQLSGTMMIEAAARLKAEGIIE